MSHYTLSLWLGTAWLIVERKGGDHVGVWFLSLTASDACFRQHRKISCCRH